MLSSEAPAAASPASAIAMTRRVSQRVVVKCCRTRRLSTTNFATKPVTTALAVITKYVSFCFK